ncbi:MAG: hypothetical protein IJC37_00570 [Clostridia bacterium]|nr:hypothetical protein [Clostridia bacterium]
MKIKKVIALFLSALLILSFASCSKEPEGITPDVTDSVYTKEYTNSDSAVSAVLNSTLPNVDTNLFPQLASFNSFCGEFQLTAESGISTMLLNDLCSPDNLLKTEISYETTYLSADYISVKLQSTMVWDAEPEDEEIDVKCCVFNVKTGEQLSLGDFSYNNSDYIIPKCAAHLAEIILANRDADVSSGYLFPDTDQSKIESLINPETGFYLTDNGIGFIFRQGYLALDFAGVRSFELPYDEVSYLLNLLPEPITEE